MPLTRPLPHHFLRRSPGFQPAQRAGCELENVIGSKQNSEELDWADARRATRYRVWLQAVGETEFRAVSTVYDSDATLTGLPLGQNVKLRVTAANDAGESGPSAVVGAVVG